MIQESWRGADFNRPGGSSSRGDRFGLRLFAALVVGVAGAVFLVSRSRAVFRCRQECYGDSPLDRYGSLTYEPGHAWTQYADSWQWGAQHGLAQFAVLSSLVGLALAATSKRSPALALGMTAIALAAWLVWVLLSPPIP